MRTLGKVSLLRAKSIKSGLDRSKCFPERSPIAQALAKALTTWLLIWYGVKFMRIYYLLRVNYAVLRTAETALALGDTCRSIAELSVLIR